MSASDALSGMAAFDVSVAQFNITWTGLQPRVVELRAERQGGGTGHVYTISASASDKAGNTANSSSGNCMVFHDSGIKGGPAKNNYLRSGT